MKKAKTGTTLKLNDKAIKQLEGDAIAHASGGVRKNPPWVYPEVDRDGKWKNQPDIPVPTSNIAPDRARRRH